jgi:type IV secretion system protein VirB5
MVKKPKGSSRASKANAGTDLDSPYTDARVIDIGLLEREQRHAASWRRAFFGAVAIAFISLVTSLVLATKDHTEAVVYKEDTSGDIALIGLSSHARVPSDEAVKHQLTVWLDAVRDIPGADDDLINRNAQTVLYMTASDSPALAAYRNFIIADNPKKLAAEGYRRTVGDVDVSKLADLTYRLAWREKLRAAGGKPQEQTFTGTVYLVGDPTVPNDPVIGQYNPAGLFIKDFDMNWSILKS